MTTNAEVDPSVQALLSAERDYKPKLEDMLEALDRAEAKERLGRLRAGVTDPTLFRDSVGLQSALDLLRRITPHKAEFARWLKSKEGA